MPTNKWRGKRIDNKEWIFGWLVIINGKTYIVFDMDSEGKMCYVEVIPETVGQWTGFLDENEQEVYEGDILFARITGEGYNVEVFWNEELGCWDMRDDEDLSWFDIYRGLSPFQTHDYKVIGNIYDTPEKLSIGGDEDE